MERLTLHNRLYKLRHGHTIELTAANLALSIAMVLVERSNTLEIEEIERELNTANIRHGSNNISKGKPIQ